MTALILRAWLSCALVGAFAWSYMLRNRDNDRR